MNRKIPLWTVLLLFWLFCIATVIFGWAVWNIEEGGNRFGKSTKTLVMSVAKFPTLVGATFTQLAQPNPLILADKYPDINGLKTEKKYVDHNYILISSFDKKAGQSTIKIIRLSDQKILHKWTPDINQIVKITQNPKEEKLTKTNIIFRHPLLATDGSMILEIPFRLLFKIDKNSHL